MFYIRNCLSRCVQLNILEKHIKKQIAEAKTNIYFEFSKIFCEQLSTFSSNNLYNEFQQSYNDKDI